MSIGRIIIHNKVIIFNFKLFFLTFYFRFKAIPMVERSAVNRNVVGSSPTGGARAEQRKLCSVFVFQIYSFIIFGF